MTTLRINDLPRNEEMDSKDMAAVEGGFTFPSVLNNVVSNRLLAPLPVTPPSHGLPPGGDVGDGGSGGGGSYNDGPYGGEDLHEQD